MSTFDLRGLGVAMVTPFTAQSDIDYKMLATHIGYLIDSGTDYIVALGTTAETPTLSPEEYKEVAHAVVDNVKGRVPVVLGLGGNNTAAVVNQIISMEGFLGNFAAILSITPYYNKPCQEGLYRHFAAIANASPVPVILYNVPGRTGVNMTAETTLRLAADFPGKIIAIKEASGNLDQVERIIRNAPDGFYVISGDDALTVDMIRLGAAGVISVVGNALPGLFSHLVHSALNNDNRTADAINRSLARLYPLLFRDGNPSGIKALLAMLPATAHNDVLRLPLVRVSPSTRDEIAEAVRELGVKLNH